MKRGAVLVLLCAFCVPASATEWKKIMSSSDFDAYIDISRIRWAGEVASVWKLMDYRLPQQEETVIYSSGKIRTEYDCARDRQRTTFVAVYSTELGMGELVKTVDKAYARWQPIIPGSVGDAVYRFVCNWNPFVAPS